MHSRRRGVVFAVIALLILCFPFNGYAADKFTIKPKISTSWQTDSNFYKAETNQRKVYTYLVQPGIELGYQTAKSRVLLDYTLDAYYYDDQDDVPVGQKSASENDFYGHTVRFSARTQPFSRLVLGVDELFYKTRDAGLSDTLSNAVDRDKYYINQVTPSIVYKFGPVFSAGLKYQNTEMNYAPDTREDSSEHRGIGDLIYNFTPLTSLDLEYQIWERSYTGTSSTFTSNQAKLILRKQFNYFAVEAGGGYHKREFDNPGLDDINLFTYTVGIRAQNPPAPAAKPRSYLAFTANRNLNDSGEGDAYFKANKFSLNAGHIFLEKLLVDLTATYQKSDYETVSGTTPEGTTEVRDDDVYEIAGKVGYLITDQLTFSVTAGYQTRDSNLAGYDYDNKYVMLKLDFGYELGRK